MYREHAPSPALRPYVACYWTSDAAVSPGARVLPDGCIDILVSCSSRRTTARVVGAMTRALLLEPGPAQRIAAIRFRPGGATPFLRIPAHEMTDSQVELANCWRVEGLADRLAETPEDAARVAMLESALAARLPAIGCVDRRIAAAVALLRGGSANVESAAAQVGVTRQHLNRLFRREVGLGPKQFERVARMQRLRSLLRQAALPNWPALALEAGYCDQSHMIREHRALTGLTPRVFHSSNTPAAA